MKWPEFNLSKLTRQFISGGTPSTKNQEYWSGDIPWITGADFSDGEVVIGRRYINKNAVNNSATHIVPVGSILMVTRTSVGKIAIAPVDIAISQDITGIVPRQVVNSKFLVSAIRQRMDVILAAQRGATINGVTRDDIKLLPIPLPALSEQRRIVEILDQADALRTKRSEANAKASRILPALFYKMFGDPFSLMLEKESIPLGQFDLDLQNGFACGQKDVEAGIPHLRMNNIDDAGVLNLDLIRTVPTEKDGKRYRLQAGDILFMGTNSEDKIGKTCVFFPPDDRHYLFSNHLIRIRILDDRINPEYLGTYLHLLWQKRFYPSMAKRWVNQAAIAQGTLAKIRVPVPNKQAISQFKRAFHELLLSRSRRSKSFKSLEDLFATLLHRSFTGDLTAQWREAHMKELLGEMEEQAKYLNTTVAKV